MTLAKSVVFVWMISGLAEATGGMASSVPSCCGIRQCNKDVSMASSSMKCVLKEKFTIETLPITKDFLREKRLIEKRGELVLLADGEEIRHITFFTLNPGPNYFRGGHYHKKKVEKFYVVSGKLRISLVDVEINETEVLELEAWQRVTIHPMCAHKFQAITPAQVIEYYATSYDPDDDIRFESFHGEQSC